MAVDIVKLTPESFKTIYLRKEDRIVLRTEAGRKIIIKRIIPSQWKPWRIYDQESTINANKKEVFLIDQQYLDQVTETFSKKIRGK
jgi:hypothetical protein